MSAVLLSTAEDRFVTVNGLRLHYREVGDASAPAVVMLHGIMGHAREWDVLVGSLAARFRMIVVDQRGHGESDWADEYTASAMADDLVELIGHLGLFRPAVVGHSMGAMAAMLATARHPRLIDRLVVIDVGPDSVSGELAAGLAEFVSALGQASYPTVDAAYAEWADNPLARPELLRHYVEHCLRVDHRGQMVWRFDGTGLVRFFDGVDQPELWCAVDHIACPVLVIRGEHSPALSAPTAEAMVGRLTDGQSVTIPDGGHDLGVEQPEAVADAALRFLAR